MRRLAQGVVSLFFQGVSLIRRHVQRLIEENLLAFPPGNIMLLPILVAIGTIPFKSPQVLIELHRQQTGMYMLNIYTNS